MRRTFWDVADSTWPQRESFAADAQTAAAFDDVADDVLVSVVDLFRIGFFRRSEGDQTAGELLFCEAIGVADLVTKFFKTSKGLTDPDEFHLELGWTRGKRKKFHSRLTGSP